MERRGTRFGAVRLLRYHAAMQTFILTACLGAAALYSPTAPREDIGDSVVLTLSRSTPVVVADGATPEERARLQVLFDAIAFELPVVEASARRGGGPAIYVGEAVRHSALRDRSVERLYSSIAAPTGPEGYRVAVSRGGIAVVGASEAGTFYGLLRLAKLAEGAGFPEARIRGEPFAPIRGIRLADPPSIDQCATLARAGCNLVIFPPDTGWNAAAAWCRAWCIVAVPDLTGVDAEATRSWLGQAQVEYTFAEGQVPAMSGTATRIVRASDRPADTMVLWNRPIGAAVSGLPDDALVLVTPEPTTAGAYASAAAFLNRPPGTTGLIWDAAPGDADAMALALERAWTGTLERNAWAEGLNAFFGTEYWAPDESAIFDALTARLNGRTLQGVAPDAERQALDAVAARVRTAVPGGAVDQVDALYRILTDYVALEHAFTINRDAGALARLARLVADYAAMTSRLDADRAERIVAIIREQGKFVPAGILFDRPIAFYRPVRVPSGHSVHAIAAEPAYTDGDGTSTAVLDFLAPFALVRVDYETVGAAAVDVAVGSDGVQFDRVRRWEAEPGRDLWGPLLLESPVITHYARLTADIPGRLPLLRHVMAAGLKPPAAGDCAATSSAPDVDGWIEERAWDRAAPLDAFVAVDGYPFAAAPTSVRLMRTHRALYAAVTAHEPRMDTAVLEGGDGERVELVFAPPGGAAQTIAVYADGRTAAGARAAVRRGSVSWTAEVEVPLDLLGPTPDRGATWRFNAIRHRRNVIEESSAWALDEHQRGSTQPTGILAFP